MLISLKYFGLWSNRFLVLEIQDIRLGFIGRFKFWGVESRDDYKQLGPFSISWAGLRRQSDQA